MVAGWVMKLTTRMGEAQRGHTRGSTSRSSKCPGGSSPERFDAMEYVARVPSRIPEPRKHQVRHYGYSPVPFFRAADLARPGSGFVDASQEICQSIASWQRLRGGSGSASSVPLAAASDPLSPKLGAHAEVWCCACVAQLGRDFPLGSKDYT